MGVGKEKLRKFVKQEITELALQEPERQEKYQEGSHAQTEKTNQGQVTVPSVQRLESLSFIIGD